jgi:hypothetical protein
MEMTMAIYTQYGSRVLFLSARIVKVWTTLGNIGNGHELKWHYTEPTPPKSWRNVEIDSMDVWHVTARYDDDRKGHGGTKPISGERSISEYVADDGIREILDECYRLNPIDAEAERLKFRDAA